MSERKSDGGTAFPHPGAINGQGQTVVYPELGMSLRDYFAAQALPVALGIRPFHGAKDSRHGNTISISSPSGLEQLANWRRNIVAEAYALADAMLEARNA